jgi:hypothetical protein
MPYTLNNFDGTQLKIVADGTIDRQYTTSLNLIGKLVSNYGELQQENFVWLLQNFSSSVEPVNKIQGQTWFDKSTSVLKLKVYDGTEWKAISVTKAAVSAPSSTQGDFWLKTSTKQLFVGTGTGTNWSLVGPDAVEGFGETGFRAVKVLDTTNGEHLVLKLMMNGKAVGAVSTSSFNVKSNESIYTDGWPTLIDGLNLRSITATNVTLTGLNAVSVTATSISSVDVNSTNVTATKVVSANTLTSTVLSVSGYGYITSMFGTDVHATEIISPRISSGSTATTGAIEGSWSLTAGSILRSSYADLAENYEADDTYSPGMVLEFGGIAEVTLCQTDMSTSVAGIISTKPAYLMHDHHEQEGYVYPIALSGRVPCNVKGKIKKGDLLVSGAGGFARADKNPKVGTVVAKAMEDYDSTDIGQIEVMVWRG